MLELFNLSLCFLEHVGMVVVLSVCLVLNFRDIYNMYL